MQSDDIYYSIYRAHTFAVASHIQIYKCVYKAFAKIEKIDVSVVIAISYLVYKINKTAGMAWKGRVDGANEEDRFAWAIKMCILRLGIVCAHEWLCMRFNCECIRNSVCANEIKAKHTMHKINLEWKHTHTNVFSYIFFSSCFYTLLSSWHLLRLVFLRV